MLKATLLGGTGLIGGHILEYLLEDPMYTSVSLILRHKVEITHPKVKSILIDFNDQVAFKAAIEPDSIIFCAIGTTQKKVNGDKIKYRQVDYDIPLHAATYALSKNCKVFSLVSSIGANANSSNFYTKLKGEVEDDISNLGFSIFHIFRPSILIGNRKESRLLEDIFKRVMTLFSFLIPDQFKPIQAKDVAKAMVIAAKSKHLGSQIFRYREIKDLV